MGNLLVNQCKRRIDEVLELFEDKMTLVEALASLCAVVLCHR